MGVGSKKRRELWETREHVCALCGGEILCYDAMDVDHIYPKSLGGSDDDYNLQLTHRSCNIKKGNKIPMQQDIRACFTDEEYRIYKELWEYVNWRWDKPTPLSDAVQQIGGCSPNEVMDVFRKAQRLGYNNVNMMDIEVENYRRNAQLNRKDFAGDRFLFYNRIAEFCPGPEDIYMFGPAGCCSAYYAFQHLKQPCVLKFVEEAAGNVYDGLTFAESLEWQRMGKASDTEIELRSQGALLRVICRIRGILKDQRIEAGVRRGVLKRLPGVGDEDGYVPLRFFHEVLYITKLDEQLEDITSFDEVDICCDYKYRQYPFTAFVNYPLKHKKKDVDYRQIVLYFNLATNKRKWADFMIKDEGGRLSTWSMKD